ncbi:hypothetical protein ACFQI3_10280 [Hansschlegelia quercus]|uniref:Uncharacterized protein n=1 Tax=Hansschlegelia quercus TaxID=2528245 RepID=A0A4Q9GJX7_9HYPH|nr:hypothetical protein [Hansschlegelia quercus]TBN54448.1 hypothetical protein EYR15_06355 [Hansschlegelia quercus]
MLDQPFEDGHEYVVLPEEALEFLPQHWRDQMQEIVDDGRAVLRSVDNELSSLSRLTRSLGTLVTLKHIQSRLTLYRFAPTMEAILELDMLTTAFVVTYARLHQGGGGSGFGRGALPERLRPIHDDIIDLRNKRFAHNAGHHSVSDALEIGFGDGRFEIKLGLALGFHVGGPREWLELVKFIDELMADRMEKVRARLEAKTGRPWEMPKGPPPT